MNTKMKDILAKTMLFLVCLMGTASCNFLDEVNHSGQSSNEFYATAEGYESLVNGVYSQLRNIYNKKDYIVLSQMGTDLCTQNNTSTVSPLNQYTVTYMANQGEVYGHWKSLYTALKNTNAAIDRAPDVITTEMDYLEGMEPEILKKRVAEMKGIRALILFEIVRNWGQAPLMTNEPQGPENTATLNQPSEFYEQILLDLKDAISALPDKYDAKDFGRISAAAAKHLRALVYLTRGYESFAGSDDFKLAFEDAEDLITHSDYSLLPQYRNIHKRSNQLNDEILFSVGYEAAANNDNSIWAKFYTFPYREGWQGLVLADKYSNDDATVVPTKYAYLVFDWSGDDERTAVTFMGGLNKESDTSTDGTINGRNFFSATAKVDGKFEIGDTVIYFPTPLDESYKYYTDDDKTKLNYTVYNFPQGAMDDFSTLDEYWRLAYQTSNSNTRAFLPIWKFKDNKTYAPTGDQGTSTRDIFIFRLAETYLIAAEAAVMRNDNPNALKYINLLRGRSNPNNLYSGIITLDNILDERAIELFGEVPRWNDLQRTRKLAERALKYNYDITHITGGIQTQLNESTFNSKFNRRPLPLEWLNLLSNGRELGNNPGW